MAHWMFCQVTWWMALGKSFVNCNQNMAKCCSIAIWKSWQMILTTTCSYVLVLPAVLRRTRRIWAMRFRIPISFCLCDSLWSCVHLWCSFVVQECLTPAGFAKSWSRPDPVRPGQFHRRRIKFATAGSTCVDHSSIGTLTSSILSQSILVAGCCIAGVVVIVAVVVSWFCEQHWTLDHWTLSPSPHLLIRKWHGAIGGFKPPPRHMAGRTRPMSRGLFFLQAFCSTVACPKYLPGFWMMVFEVLAWFPGRIATWMRSSIQSGSAAEIFAEIFVAPTSRLFEVVLALKSYGTFTPLLWVAGPSASKLCHSHK